MVYIPENWILKGGVMQEFPAMPLPQAPEITSVNEVFNASGSAFSYTITASNSPTSFYVDWLPYGLAINTSSGVISGTTWANSKGVYSLTIHAVNNGGVGSMLLQVNVR
jgi:hypothetical protein